MLMSVHHFSDAQTQSMCQHTHIHCIHTALAVIFSVNHQYTVQLH